jgi:Mrp family chromosome partitioning ATPase
MGRMLDALSRKSGRLVPTSKESVPSTELKLAPETDPTPKAEEIPFIEIGGPTPTYAPSVAPAPPVQIKLLSVPKTEPKPEAVIEPIRSPWFHPDQGKRYLSVLFQPVFDGVPRSEGSPAFTDELVAHHKPDHPVSEQYRALWREMVNQLTHPHQALLFTSIHDQSGTTTVLLNLAITMLREPGKQVLLVDANPAQPAIAGRLGLAPSPGLHELLHRGLPVPLAIHRTSLPGLSVMVSGYGEGNRGGADRDRLARLLAQLRSRYDWVLIDAPAWGEDGIDVWSELCDASYLVIRQMDGDNIDLDSAHQLLHRDGKLKGYLLTKM